MGMLTNTSGIRAWDDSRLLPFVFIDERKPIDSDPCTWWNSFALHDVKGTNQMVMQWRAVNLHKFPITCDNSEWYKKE